MALAQSEIKLKKAELHRVTGSRYELEAKIDQLSENIERLKASVIVQLAAEERITKEIADATADSDTTNPK